MKVPICVACCNELVLPRSEPQELTAELIEMRNAKRRAQ
jgi:hypothetical protein